MFNVEESKLLADLRSCIICGAGKFETEYIKGESNRATNADHRLWVVNLIETVYTLR